MYNKYKNIIEIKKETIILKCDFGKNHTYEINKSLLNERHKYKSTLCTKCNPITSNISGLEIQLINYIENIYNGTILKNDRKLIKKELDIYLPELNLAFEFNGLYWHNELYKEKYYHKEKYDLCKEKGVQLIQIWEDDWKYKQNIIKSMISNKINNKNQKIFARKCKIKEIKDNKLIKEFLVNNHIQGFVNSSTKIGLYYENELVSLMTFGKKRKLTNNNNNELDFELLRFCNKLNTSVIGGASKLFKYFTNNYEYNEITTYADKTYSNGKLYEILNFKFIHESEPNYYYIIGDKRYHRFNFRKSVLVKEGFDPNKTEHEIMLERKIYRIYNAGNYKYIF